MTSNTSDQLLRDVQDAPDSGSAAKRLGDCLGLSGPAPILLTERVLADPVFGKMLISLRNVPEVRDQLMAEKKPFKSNSINALKQAATGILKWGMDGLKPADPWVISRRLAACNACEHQVPAPETLVYRGAKIMAGKDSKICRICNCLTNTKAAISTERCPMKSEENPNHSKWSEPWVEPMYHPRGPW